MNERRNGAAESVNDVGHDMREWRYSYCEWLGKGDLTYAMNNVH